MSELWMHTELEAGVLSSTRFGVAKWKPSELNIPGSRAILTDLQRKSMAGDRQQVCSIIRQLCPLGYGQGIVTHTPSRLISVCKSQDSFKYICVYIYKLNIDIKIKIYKNKYKYYYFSLICFMQPQKPRLTLAEDSALCWGGQSWAQGGIKSRQQLSGWKGKSQLPPSPTHRVVMFMYVVCLTWDCYAELQWHQLKVIRPNPPHSFPTCNKTHWSKSWSISPPIKTFQT